MLWHNLSVLKCHKFYFFFHVKNGFEDHHEDFHEHLDEVNDYYHEDGFGHHSNPK